MTLRFQTKITSQTAVDGVSAGTPIHSTQPNYAVNLKAADGECTWQQEWIWLSSSSAQVVNMLQKCATRQQAFAAEQHTLGRWLRRGKKNCRCIFFPHGIILVWKVWQTGCCERWSCDGVKALRLGVWCCYQATRCENKPGVQEYANMFYFYCYLNFESTFCGVHKELWPGI